MQYNTINGNNSNNRSNNKDFINEIGSRVSSNSGDINETDFLLQQLSINIQCFKG